MSFPPWARRVAAGHRVASGCDPGPAPSAVIRTGTRCRAADGAWNRSPFFSGAGPARARVMTETAACPEWSFLAPLRLCVGRLSTSSYFTPRRNATEIVVLPAAGPGAGETPALHRNAPGGHYSALGSPGASSAWGCIPIRCGTGAPGNHLSPILSGAGPRGPARRSKPQRVQNDPPWWLGVFV